MIGNKSDEASIKISRTLKSASAAQLKKAEQEVFIDTLLVGDELHFFIEAPDRVFKIDEEGDGYYDGWNQSWSDFKHFKLAYTFTWEVQIPESMDLQVKTHQKQLSIRNMASSVVARNHHDDVALSGLSGDVKASSHHGDVNVAFVSNPPEEVSCHSHHGDIRVEVQDGLSADVTMRSHHGSFYTDFDWQNIPVQVDKDAKNGKTRYRWAKGTQVRIGEGGLKMDFHTHHGDVYVTK